MNWLTTDMKLIKKVISLIRKKHILNRRNFLSSARTWHHSRNLYIYNKKKAVAIKKKEIKAEINAMIDYLGLRDDIPFEEDAIRLILALVESECMRNHHNMALVANHTGRQTILDRDR